MRAHSKTDRTCDREGAFIPQPITNPFRSDRKKTVAAGQSESSTVHCCVVVGVIVIVVSFEHSTLTLPFMFRVVRCIGAHEIRSVGKNEFTYHIAFGLL